MLRLIALAAALAAAPALAHDHWISRGGYRNAAGEWCCGEDDCFVVTGVHAVTLPTAGCRLPDGEFVPLSDTQPSPDGQFWRCRRPDGSRRCFLHRRRRADPHVQTIFPASCRTLP